MNLKHALATKQALIGTFIKTTHYHNTEVLAHSALDLLCLDAEHAPFDRSDLDACILAAKSNNMPTLVRVPNTHSSTILNALDLGAQGVVLPHIINAEQAKSAVKSCFYGDQGRGYAGSTRAASYTTNTLQENLNKNQQTTCVIAQIEDIEGVQNIDSIAQVKGIDSLFIGRMDLTVALGKTDPSDPEVLEMVSKVVEAANKHHINCGMFVGDLSELPHWLAKGVSLFILGSDHGFMLNGAKQLKATFDEALTSTTLINK